MAYNGRFWEYPPKERQRFFLPFSAPPCLSGWGIFTDTYFSTKILLAMLTESRAIVLRTIKYNDESFIAETLTEGHGRVSFLVRISRSPRAAVRHTLSSRWLC